MVPQYKNFPSDSLLKKKIKSTHWQIKYNNQTQDQNIHKENVGCYLGFKFRIFW